MALYNQEIKKLERIIKIAQKLIAEYPKPKRGRPALKGPSDKRAKGKRIRRTGKELVAFRKMLKAERKRGASVAKLAKTHGISPAYIYLLP